MIPKVLYDYIFSVDCHCDEKYTNSSIRQQYQFLLIGCLKKASYCYFIKLITLIINAAITLFWESILYLEYQV